jgi:phosphatidylserine decarboxylase
MPRAKLEPMDPQITSIQPGGGFCMRLELAWGGFRRAYLRIFWPKYVEEMHTKRRGSDPYKKCPHEVLDPRDLKFHRNQETFFWEPQDDPFRWRDRLPFARVGLCELMLISGFFFTLTGLAVWIFCPSAVVWGFLGLCIVWFFRNPQRNIPDEPGLVVSPADGKVVEVREIEYDEFLDGPAVQIGIFLSVFNVHINRVPVASRVIGLRYRRGKFLNAMRAASSRENEQLAVKLEENAEPHRRMIVRQITGAIARRIVCWVKPGDELSRGEQFGMIKLGSRTELVIPREPGLKVEVVVGQKVKAGSSVMARYENLPLAPAGGEGAGG